MSTLFDPADPLSPAFRAAIADRIEAHIAGQADVVAAMQPDIAPLVELARAFTAGGKRLRPAFCAWGYLAAAAPPADPVPLLDAAASLDLLHVSALMHDDVMDSSATRRGQPAAHVQFAALHGERDGDGDPATFGRAGAILLGDLLVMWSAEMFDRSGWEPERLAAARRYLELMRTEVTGGQFLDVRAQTLPLAADPAVAVAAAERVVEFKSARYTVRRPLQIGAALAGADAELQQALARYGSPLGRAFQYRDDVLGIFGDEAVTGKPAGDDLREGKRTVLLGHALGGLEPGARAELAGLVGTADLDATGVERARELIGASGALESCEDMIQAALSDALLALESARIRPEARTALQALAVAAVERSA